MKLTPTLATLLLACACEAPPPAFDPEVTPDQATPSDATRTAIDALLSACRSEHYAAAAKMILYDLTDSERFRRDVLDPDNGTELAKAQKTCEDLLDDFEADELRFVVYEERRDDGLSIQAWTLERFWRGGVLSQRRIDMTPISDRLVFVDDSDVDLPLCFSDCEYIYFDCGSAVRDSSGAEVPFASCVDWCTRLSDAHEECLHTKECGDFDSCADDPSPPSPEPQPLTVEDLGGYCESNVSCSEPTFCLHILPTDAGFCSTFCSSDSDCPSGAECSSNFCWPAARSNFTGNYIDSFRVRYAENDYRELLTSLRISQTGAQLSGNGFTSVAGGYQPVTISGQVYGETAFVEFFGGRPELRLGDQRSPGRRIIRPWCWSDESPALRRTRSTSLLEADEATTASLGRCRLFARSPGSRETAPAAASARCPRPRRRGARSGT